MITSRRVAAGLGFVAVAVLLLVIGLVVLDRGVQGSPVPQVQTVAPTSRPDPGAIPSQSPAPSTKPALTQSTSPSVTPGASADPPRFDPAPAAGSCLVNPYSSVEYVPCDQRHDAEVALSWIGSFEDFPVDEIRPKPRSDFRAMLQDDPEFACQIYARNDFHPEPSTLTDWYRVGLDIDFELIAGPYSEEHPDLAWSACVVTTARISQLAGSAHPDRFSLDALSHSALRWCNAGHDALGVGRCYEPHSLEVVAFLEISASDPLNEVLLRDAVFDENSELEPIIDVDEPELAGQCADLIEEYVGAPLDAHDGALRPFLIVLESDWDDDEGRPVLYVDCHVGTTDDRLLDSTLAGHGADPLPFS